MYLTISLYQTTLYTSIDLCYVHLCRMLSLVSTHPDSFMANIFNEVDEDIRKERYQNLWSNYGKYIIAFLMLIVIAFSLTQYFQAKNISDNKAILDIYYSAAEGIEKNLGVATDVMQECTLRMKKIILILLKRIAKNVAIPIKK